MAETELKFPKTKWIDIINPSEDAVDELMSTYNFHELDRDALIESNQTARVDTYEHYLFVVLHFPKYDPKTKRYLTNEFNIFVAKDYLITVRYYASQSLDKLQDQLEKSSKKKGASDISSGTILYQVIDQMLDKVFRSLERFGKDLRQIEKSIFDSRKAISTSLIQEIMIKKRNIITLKHMIKPQIQAIKLLELRTKSMFSDSIEVYFENLDDKVQKIATDIELLQENIESIEGTLKTIFDMETNSTIKYLTIFSAFMLPLTLITSFFGMNIENVPFTDALVYSLMVATTVILFIILGVLRYFKKI
ncbi:MAG: magnesium transporter CorA family protein [Candidatus Gracilibacteria bacterium]|nr:magnesium transporter CorA family protein [Candidatus Gracilibacteria bacterium]